MMGVVVCGLPATNHLIDCTQDTGNPLLMVAWAGYVGVSLVLSLTEMQVRP